MPASSEDPEKLGLELLRIKAAINQGSHAPNDVEIYRSCLAREDNLALIAAGYALSEGLLDVKETAIQVVQKKLAEIKAGGALPTKWTEVAILEGLLFADVATLLRVKDSIIAYLQRLLADPPKIEDVGNASSLLHRLASLNIQGAADLIKKIEKTA